MASDEYYVLDLCDEVIGNRGQRQATFPWLVGDVSPKTGQVRRLYDQRKVEMLSRYGIRVVVIHKFEFKTRADKIVRDRELDIAVVRTRLA